MVMANYEYAALKSGEFRLLRFRSVDEDSPQDFALDVIHRNTKDSADTTNQGGYVAISYAWDTPLTDGGSEETSTSASKDFSIWSHASWSWTRSSKPQQSRVVIGDEKASKYLTPTLHALLSSLHGKIFQPFWIDQLCINQADAVEKGIQVENMGQIYGGALQVIVWLGPEERPSLETEGSGAAIKFLHQLCLERKIYGLPENNESVGKYHEILTAINATEDESETSTLIDKFKFLDLVEARLLSFPSDGIRRFLERQWFTRIWTIQEVSLAKDVMFFCGREQITWDVLRDAAAILALFDMIFGRNAGGIRDRFDVDVIPQISTKLGLVNVIRLAHLVRTRRSLVDYKEKHTLLSLVKRFNVNTGGLLLGASDKRDRIFGLLGMAIKSLDIEGKYEREVEDIYTKFAAKEIQAGNIDLLALASSAKTLPTKLFPGLPFPMDTIFGGIIKTLLPRGSLCKFPTWVPDWDPPLTGSLRMPYGFNDTLDPLFSAGLKLPSKVSSRDNVLIAQGVLLDVVDEISNVSTQLDPNAWNSIDAHCSVYYLKDIERLCLKAMSRRPSYSESWFQDARWRIAVGGVTAHVSKTYSRADEQSFHWREELNFLHRLFRHVCLGSSSWANFNTFRKAYRCKEHGSLAILQSLARNLSWWASKWLIDLALWVGERWWWTEPLQPIGALPPMLGEFCGVLFEMRDRRAYLTRSGYVGLGPLSLKKGDVIVVFGGGSVPFALRRSWNGRYKLLGEAYCDGCMGPEPPEGELVDFELV